MEQNCQKKRIVYFYKTLFTSVDSLNRDTGYKETMKIIEMEE